MHRVINMAAGADTALLPGPLGLIIMLLLEGAVGREAAVARAGTGDGDVVERAVIAGVVAFARTLDPSATWDERHFALYGGYALTEARRRLSAIIIEPPSRRRSSLDPPKRIFIEHGKEQAVIAFVIRDLRRRDVTLETFRQAVAAAVAAHRRVAEPSRQEQVQRQAPNLLYAVSAAWSDSGGEQAPHRVPPRM